MAINIPYNDYKQPTIVREEAVQAICEAFLNSQCFAPYMIPSEAYVLIGKDGKGKEFTTELDGRQTLNFNGAEMSQAFKILLEHDYYMFQDSSAKVGKRYFCSKKPIVHHATRINSFDDFID